MPKSAVLVPDIEHYVSDMEHIVCQMYNYLCRKLKDRTKEVGINATLNIRSTDINNTICDGYGTLIRQVLGDGDKFLLNQ
jgi:hypothetical protein